MTWDELYFNMIQQYKMKSKDPSSKFACLVVAKDNSIKASGFNGFPRGVNDSKERYDDRKTKYLYVVHAEANAIASAAKAGVSLENCFIYIDTFPCSSCTKLIIQSGISQIILNGDSEIHNNLEFQTRWSEDIEVTTNMCNESGVEIRIFNKAMVS
jgi:dCMP deaminase